MLPKLGDRLYANSRYSYLALLRSSFEICETATGYPLNHHYTPSELHGL